MPNDDTRFADRTVDAAAALGLQCLTMGSLINSIAFLIAAHF